MNKNTDNTDIVDPWHETTPEERNKAKAAAADRIRAAIAESEVQVATDRIRWRASRLRRAATTRRTRMRSSICGECVCTEAGPGETLTVIDDPDQPGGYCKKHAESEIARLRHNLAVVRKELRESLGT